MLDITAVAIGIASVLFVFLSTILSKLSYDETEYASNLKMGGTIGVVILSIIVGVLFEQYSSMLVVIFFSILMFSKLNSYYTHRSLSYVLIYILLFTQPLFASFIALLEFFNMSFYSKKLNTRFELLLLCGFVVSVVSVFFVS